MLSAQFVLQTPKQSPCFRDALRCRCPVSRSIDRKLFDRFLKLLLSRVEFSFFLYCQMDVLKIQRFFIGPNSAASLFSVSRRTSVKLEHSIESKCLPSSHGLVERKAIKKCMTVMTLNDHNTTKWAKNFARWLCNRSALRLTIKPGLHFGIDHKSCVRHPCSIRSSCARREGVRMVIFQSFNKCPKIIENPNSVRNEDGWHKSPKKNDHQDKSNVQSTIIISAPII